MTKRILLSPMNSIFDPLGIVAPFTVRAKLILKNLWRLKLDGDEDIVGIERRNVLSFLNDMFDIEKISFKRCMKPEGSVVTCGNSRAIYCDLAQDYSTDGFLQTFRKFISIRGYPSNIRSDCGLQLVAADKELTAMVKGFDKDEISIT